MKELPIVRTVAGLRAACATWRAEGDRIALVPTMGALHEGHIALVREGASRANKVVVSIFVNPAQFAPHEDFDRYPRKEAADAAKLAATGAAHLIYAPQRQEVYGAGFSTRIAVSGPAEGLESDFRPHFFAGVATVVAKLLIQCAPDFAIFGEKDYQQLQVVKRMVRDLELPAEIIGVQTVREEDGLAMSSRNAYLSPREREIAGRLNVILRESGRAARSGRPVAACEAEAREALERAGFTKVDYAAIRDAETLKPVAELSAPARILAAAHIGKTRLIDNMAV